MTEPVLVTELEFRKAAELFVAAGCEPAPAVEQALADAVKARGARVVIVGVAPYCGPLYEAVAGGLIARFGVGHDGINKTLAKQQNIIVTNTPGALDASVAELAIWLMGCAARPRGGAVGVELRGKTLGVLGFGNIGKRVAQIAEHGLGMKVLACDIGAGFVSAEELFRKSDVISVHLPSNADTRHFINATRLSWMKRSALLVNTSRGAVLDEAALYDALAARRLGGAALDVLEIEPYQPVVPGKDLRTLDNVVLTPHIGSNTREANRRMAEMCLENVRHFLAGELERLTRVKTT